MSRTVVHVVLVLTLAACSGDGEAVNEPFTPPPPPVVPPVTVIGTAFVEVEFGEATLAGLDVVGLRLRLQRAAGTVALDTVVALSPDSTSVGVALAAPVDRSQEQFILHLALAGVLWDTLFRAGPDTLELSVNGSPTMVSPRLRYVGIGYDARDVVIAPSDAVLLIGDTVALAATALDGAGKPIPATPVIWTSLDISVVTLLDGAGHVTSAGIGVGRVEARLLTGPADTAKVTVSPRAAGQH